MKKELPIAVALIVLLSQSVFLASAWKVERPYRFVNIDDRTDNSYTNGEASVGVGVAINEYTEDYSEYDGSDVISMNITMSANSRRGIAYDCYWWGDLLWYDVYDQTNIVGDDAGAWIDIPQNPYTFEFRFFGGWMSAEYQKAWVCTNGFISFDLSISTSRGPSSFPRVDAPNALIAGLWADLLVDQAASITTGIAMYLSNSYFVISWNNVLHKASGERLSFQIILEEAKYPTYNPAYVQSRVWISYKSLEPINDYYTIGIEDHEGCKSAGPGRINSDLTDFEGKTLELYQSSSSFFLKCLTIKFEEEDNAARVELPREEPYGRITGINVKRRSGQTPQPDSTYAYVTAFAGVAILLLEAKSGILLFKVVAGVAGGVLVGFDCLDALSYWMEDKVEPLDIRDSFEGPNPSLPQGGYIKVETLYECGVDAELGIRARWILDDPGNTAYHSLRITAELNYFELTRTGQVIEKPSITSSVDLEVAPDDNESFDTADPMSVGSHTLLYLDYIHDQVDFYKMNMPENYAIHLEMEPPVDADYNLYLYDPDLTLKDSSEGGVGQTDIIDHECVRGGYWYIKVNSLSSHGLYNLSIGTYALPPNNPPETPSTPEGNSYTYYTGISYSFYTLTTDPDGDDVRYTFSWDDGSNTTTTYYHSGYYANASHTWNSAGTYNVRTRAQDVHGALSNWSANLTLTVSSGSGGGGGGGGGECPTLFSWNGTAYAEEGLLDIHGDNDVTVDYTLRNLISMHGLCLLSLRELDNYTSHIDQVKLYAVDSQGVWHECSLIVAWHNELGPVKQLLSEDDESKVNLAPCERITLLFFAPGWAEDAQLFIFELNGHNRKAMY